MHTHLCGIVLLGATVLACAAGCSSPSTAGKRYPKLASVFARMKGGDRLTVCYLGGSITWGATATDPMRTSYRALTSRWLETAYPDAHIRSIDAAIGGHPSKLGVFRMDRDVLPYDPDLVFVEFAVNDGNAKDSRETMEGIVRKLRAQNPDVAVVILIIGAGRETYKCRQRENHLAVAAHYGLPVVDIAEETRKRIAAGEFTGGDILSDGCHPNDRGYAVYAGIIRDTLTELAAKPGRAPAWPDAPLTENRYEKGYMLELSTLPNLGGWTPAQPSVVGTWFDHQPSRWQSSCIAATKDGAEVATRLSCSGVGVYYEMRVDGGDFDLIADGETLKTLSARNKLWEGRVRFWFGAFLDPGEHEIRLRARLPEGAKAEDTRAAYLLLIP